jgi:cytochrome c556
MRLVLALLLVMPIFAAGEEDFVKWMKETGGLNGKIRKSVQEDTLPEAVKAAERLQAIFKDVEGFYAASKTEDAVKFAKDAQLAAKALGAGAAAGNKEEVTAAAKTLGGTCQGCHTTHREKLADGTYKFK